MLRVLCDAIISQFINVYIPVLRAHTNLRVVMTEGHRRWYGCRFVIASLQGYLFRRSQSIVFFTVTVIPDVVRRDARVAA